MSLSPFHLAIPVVHLEEARVFYRDIIGCQEGRSSDLWVDFDFYGHQLVIHLKKQDQMDTTINPVDGKSVPVPHFGIVLPWDEFETLSAKIKKAGIEFIIEPYIRFQGEEGEQATMFFEDPSGNALEFKSFKDLTKLFAK